MLPAFSEDEETSRPSKVIKTEMEMEQEQVELNSPSQQSVQQQMVQAPSLNATPTSGTTTQYAPTVVQTISNPDGTVSIIQVGPLFPFSFVPHIFVFLKDNLRHTIEKR